MQIKYTPRMLGKHFSCDTISTFNGLVKEQFTQALPKCQLKFLWPNIGLIIITWKMNVDGQRAIKVTTKIGNIILRY